ncbi:hypothetical protein N865_02060 [Intrasporangium oryzae NRRL B-24470]|uniref:Uncharacterized protein n=1 Tax=Intrasporangium oryzae NRRL B-24470 TaxID=1386089 RepID=W9G0W7_9MICO|nr:hypothetical protein [Intrasporangium oryzae]EWS99564.1 hypothetical protein N865_02060 [Intrasporangium oryzae NRRL B-24470]
MTLTPAPSPPDDADDGVLDGFDLPETWTASAVDTFREILTARPDLAGAELSALEQACSLITTADHLADVARDAAYVATGSQGQEILHPAVAEARLTRTAAAQILARLTVTSSRVQTSSERARSAARARWGSRGGVS